MKTDDEKRKMLEQMFGPTMTVTQWRVAMSHLADHHLTLLALNPSLEFREKLITFCRQAIRMCADGNSEEEEDVVLFARRVLARLHPTEDK